MTTLPLLVITTRLPPAVCGIGTFSWLLHRHWPENDRDVRFLVVDGAANSTAELKLAGISEFDGQPVKLSTILDEIGAGDLLLHYAGRAYHRYGCPFWLPIVLENWKRKFSASRIVIFFHELPGNNFPITSRFFWIDQCNRRVVRRLARLADAVATNTREHARMLERISNGKDVRVVPVGSNIEPGSEPVGPKKKTEAAIFGLPFGRWQTLDLFGRVLREWQTNGRLTKLHLIGQTDNKFDQRSERLIENLPRPESVIRHGFLSAEEVSSLLGQVQLGLTNATVENWSKSTTFMAYAAHGCVIVGNLKGETAPLKFTVLPEEVSSLSEADLNARGTMLRQWYHENASWKSIAAQFKPLFAGTAESVSL